MRPTSILAITICLTALTGCRSPYVTTTVSNHTPAPITLVEVDYPSASFGTQTLTPGTDFHYRFKVLGSGALKLSYTDSTSATHSATGPFLKEGAEGPLQIVIASDGVHWQTPLGSAPPQP
jgi:hypothetical protein